VIILHVMILRCAIEA